MVRREKLGRRDTYMYQTRKIGVVGQGHVGAHVANSLLMQGIADELYPVSYTHLTLPTILLV